MGTFLYQKLGTFKWTLGYKVLHSCFKLNFRFFFAALLIRLQVTEKSKTNGRKLTELRESAHELLKQSEMSEAKGDSEAALRLHQEAQKKETEVMSLLKN